ASSVMSKKIASGASHILLDVKYGRGAFMSSIERARSLAVKMVDIGKRVGKPTVAIITCMDEPLGNAIGNSLEVEEALSVLRGEGGSEALKEVVFAICKEMLKLADPSLDQDTIYHRLHYAYQSGEAFQKFKQMIEAQGGSLDAPLPRAKISTSNKSNVSGYIVDIDALLLGRTAVEIGAGRKIMGDSLDLSAGIVLKVRSGDYVTSEQELAVVHSNSILPDSQASSMQNSFRISMVKRDAQPLIIDIVR
ncbi:MAG: pyrimidine-nucleoside phosphorylase, partial [bacterium]|nr:pyrimidine-nucleoside phosphorylase [bacterium]